jgi:hypothetical protein
MFETHPQTVAEECDHEVSFAPHFGVKYQRSGWVAQFIKGMRSQLILELCSFLR